MNERRRGLRNEGTIDLFREAQENRYQALQEVEKAQGQEAEKMKNGYRWVQTNNGTRVLRKTETEITHKTTITMKKAYIAGCVSGRNYEDAKAQFDRAATLLRGRGYEAVNPMDFVPPDIESHEAAMRICLKLLADCREAYFLPGWRESRGARQEHEACMWLGIDTYYAVEPKTSTHWDEGWLVDVQNERCIRCGQDINY